VRLLFDENLSPDLPRLVASIFPSSAHVREVGLMGGDDVVIWRFAAERDFVLVAKDDDFVDTPFPLPVFPNKDRCGERSLPSIRIPFFLLVSRFSTFPLFRFSMSSSSSFAASC